MFEGCDINLIIGSAYRNYGKLSHGLILEPQNDSRERFNGFKVAIYKKEVNLDFERCSVVIADDINFAICKVADNLIDRIEFVDLREKNGRAVVNCEIAEFLSEGGTILVSPNENAGKISVIEEERFESFYFKDGVSLTAFGATVEEALEKGATSFSLMSREL